MEYLLALQGDQTQHHIEVPGRMHPLPWNRAFDHCHYSIAKIIT
jgi:hypothetical protein